MRCIRFQTIFVCVTSLVFALCAFAQKCKRGGCILFLHVSHLFVFLHFVFCTWHV